MSIGVGHQVWNVLCIFWHKLWSYCNYFLELILYFTSLDSAISNQFIFYCFVIVSFIFFPVGGVLLCYGWTATYSRLYGFHFVLSLFFFYIHAQCFLVMQAQWPPSSVDAYIALYSSPHADRLYVHPSVVLPSVVLFPNDNWVNINGFHQTEYVHWYCGDLILKC